MSQPQSIIVYRNPVEAQFWESGMAFPLMAGLGVFFLLFLFLCKIFERKLNRSRHSNLLLAVLGIAAAVPGILVFNHLML